MAQHRYPRRFGPPHLPWAVAFCALVAAVCCGGCTSNRLERRTVRQSATITDLQFDQVLDNLAMFACNRESLAWHVRLNGGVVQIADQGGAFLGANLGGPQVIAPNLALQSNILHQWNVDPVIESDDLELLQLAYRKALDPQDADGSLKREAYDKICEISASYHIALTRDVAFDMIETMRAGADEERQQRLDHIKDDLEQLYSEINEFADKVQKYEPESFHGGSHGAPSKLEFLKEEIIRLTNEAADESVEPVGAFYRPGRNVGLIEQAQDRIEALVKLFEEHENGEPNQFSVPWVCAGCKKDVPPCVCLIGHYCRCGRECYVWIQPERTKTFRDFVLIILSLVPQDAQESSTTITGLGAANSPSF